MRPTPAIGTTSAPLTPDLIAWNSTSVLVIECCSGYPDGGHITKIEKYLQLPSTFYTNLSGIANPRVEGVLLYFEDKFRNNTELSEALLRSISTRHEIVVWTCIPSITIRLESGTHADDALNSILRGGVPLGPYPTPPIEIQPDSPNELLSRVLFRRLFERSLESRDTTFTLNQARDAMMDQTYALQSSDEDNRLNRAIVIGSRYGLCDVEQAGVRWRLTFYIGRENTITRFLSRLTGIMAEARLDDYSHEP